MAEFYRKKKKICQMCAGKSVDYKDVMIINKYIDDIIDKLEHKYSKNVVDSTCTEKGYTTYTCNKCGDSYKDDYVNAYVTVRGAAEEDNITEVLTEIKGRGNSTWGMAKKPSTMTTSTVRVTRMEQPSRRICFLPKKKAGMEASIGRITHSITSVVTATAPPGTD